MNSRDLVKSRQSIRRFEKTKIKRKGIEKDRLSD